MFISVFHTFFDSLRESFGEQQVTQPIYYFPYLKTGCRVRGEQLRVMPHHTLLLDEIQDDGGLDH